MMTLLDRSLNLLKSDRVTITYVSGTSTAEWLVRPGRSEIEQYSEGEATLVSRLQDFVGLASELLFDGEQYDPARGDTIRWDRNEVTDIFEIMPANGDDWFEPVDAYGKWIRVHTTHIETQ